MYGSVQWGSFLHMDVTEYTPTREEYVYTFGGATPAMRVKPGTALRLWSDDASDLVEQSARVVTG
ncbi:MAG TPA: hypothetical protein VK390_06015 [Propionibacteriaceae bacterium]|nr:hypothetical protein [Propionibacteriaceae bacterium]